MMQMHSRPKEQREAIRNLVNLVLTRDMGTFTADTADGKIGAALLFVRWDEAARPVGHLETDYLAFGSTPDEALAPVLALTLEQVKAHLDHCVARSGARA